MTPTLPLGNEPVERLKAEWPRFTGHAEAPCYRAALARLGRSIVRKL